MHKLNPRTAALLSAFGWAVGYLLNNPKVFERDYVMIVVR